MKVLVMLLVAVAVAGCSVGRDTASPPAPSGQEEVDTVPPTLTEVDAPDYRPPTIVLESPYGDQTAMRGTYSVSGEEGVLFADAPRVHPKEVTAVAAGDEVTFAFPGTEIVSAGGCHGDRDDCIGAVSVMPLGCRRGRIERIPLALGPETRWTVDLEPGAYELYLSASYESEGASGFVSGSLGLTVAGAKKWDALGVSSVEPDMWACPPG
jgi:hypothetical protein